MRRITVVSVHPDDETLGCGGTILRHVSDGDEVTWIVVTSGWEPRYSAESLAIKAAEVERVAVAYGMKDVVTLGLPTTRLRELPAVQVIDAIGPVLEAATPHWVYTIHGGDVHTDHRAVVDAMSIICKPFRQQPRLERWLSFETLSSTDAAAPGLAAPFVPNVFVDVSPYIERKLEIMSMFASELQPYPFPRSAESIRALARMRGAAIGREYAEAFMLIREIRDQC
jgi:LmbE family N-acetylglucosaminyl deacetylase